MISKGIVTKSTGSFYHVLLENKTEITARLRGKIKLDNRRTTNPVSVGDEVTIEQKDADYVISKISPRKNYIIRKSVNLSKETHILASNIDLAVILFTLKEPQTSVGFLDRCLVTCEAYDIPALIVCNKVDLLSDEEQNELNSIQKTYDKIGYESLTISSFKTVNIDELREKLRDKKSLFFGHSGSGKSTLVNTLDNRYNLKTKVVSTFNDKGKHTTTFAQMYQWQFGGFIIDTPGIKEFGVVDMQKQELQDYFPEIFLLKNSCKFHNCLHVNEPKCAVKGSITESRYESYLKMLEDAE